MKRFLLPLAALTALVVLSSHDMFLKLDSYFLEPNTPSEVKLYNGTFEESGNFIRRKRMADISMVMNGARSAVDTAQWSNRDSMTVLSFTTGAPGTYVAGVSLDPWEIELPADQFNDYLASDGGADMLESRRAEGVLAEDAVEQYAKHAKVIFQVGDAKTDDWSTALGYPIEFMPLSNPYDLHPGEEFEARLMFKGQPLANQLVLVGSVETHGHGHDHDDSHEHEHAHADGTTHSHGHAPDHEHAGDAAAASGPDHTHEHAHADGTTHSHEHAPDHEHTGAAAAASGPDHSHEHAHADGTTHSHEHAPDHEHAGDAAATAAAHTHDHAHADGTKHSHEHTTDHEHAGDATAASGPDHTHEHVHADGVKHSHEHAPDHEHAGDAAAAAAAHGHEHASTQELRTDADGIVRFTAAHDGFWHLRTIHMVKSAAEGLTHESNWATLSFEVSHDHSHADGDHDHDHGGVPSYVYWIASLAIVGGLFYFFNRKR